MCRGELPSTHIPWRRIWPSKGPPAVAWSIKSTERHGLSIASLMSFVGMFRAYQSCASIKGHLRRSDLVFSDESIFIFGCTGPFERARGQCLLKKFKHKCVVIFSAVRDATEVQCPARVTFSAAYGAGVRHTSTGCFFLPSSRHLRGGNARRTASALAQGVEHLVCLRRHGGR